MKPGDRISILDDTLDVDNDQKRNFKGDTGEFIEYATGTPYDQLKEPVVRVRMDNGEFAKLYESQVKVL